MWTYKDFLPIEEIKYLITARNNCACPYEFMNSSGIIFLSIYYKTKNQTYPSSISNLYIKEYSKSWGLYTPDFF